MKLYKFSLMFILRSLQLFQNNCKYQPLYIHHSVNNVIITDFTILTNIII